MVSEIEYDKWVDELEAQVARLREALEVLWDNRGVRFQMHIAVCSWCGERDETSTDISHQVDCPFAALTTPADDWLERHDEGVRREEQERCAGKCDEAEAVAEKEACEASPHGNLRSMFLAKAGQACALATAIREADNDQPSC
jgi:hypothetical protein